MGGEKAGVHLALLGVVGSPPRGRGKVGAQDFLGLHGGITPAWAGKRDKPALILRVVKDHPRVGGEKWLWLMLLPWLWGSPPHGRGKGIKPCYHRVAMGITPAWAGKS